uniref:Protein translocase subunit SecA n=1 Tax=uncultured Alphaproteobacteria bacterium TaxID=91750 RepID=A0A6G8F2B1_9PROT|nr:protein translocase subunit SecA [uncultured Alphaproteobacteria bacterium]
MLTFNIIKVEFMIGKIAKVFFGSANDRFIKKQYKTVNKINALEPSIAALSDDELRNKTVEFRDRLKLGETLDDLLPEAFAVVREAAKRTLGQRHYDVQLIGGIVLHKGMIAEMKTGEGKTLVATLAAYLEALDGKGVHIVTVNDYLARRDAEWMGQVYRFLGLTVDYIVHEKNDEQRRAAYACDIIYGTNNELGFDYLRDNMKFSLNEMVQRPFGYAIVDEVDSILIDEARTPLIISGAAEDSSEKYIAVNSIIPSLTEKDYEKDEKAKSVVLTESGMEHVEQLLKANGLIKEGGLYDMGNVGLVQHVNNALRAHKMQIRDVDYIVKDGKVVIIDEFTGRMMEGRRYSDGLHQAIEAKEGVKIQSENQTLASITFQNYFRLYPKLAGMTGTAMTEEAEFVDIYGLSCIEIPTNRPVQREDLHDEIYRTAAEKYDAIIKTILECHEKGQPVLVGTTSIEKSELVADLLSKKSKVKFEVLNARHHEREAAIVAQAGVSGAITIATNMAGRGTDIQLGGNLDMRLKEMLKGDETPEQIDELKNRIRAEIEADKAKVLAAGGLFILGTERHESRRIDNQLRGRSGRQGDPGTSKFFLSMEDDLMRIFGSERMSSMLEKMGLPKGEPLVHPWISKALEKAQQKVEERNFDIRKNLLKYDNVMNDQRKVVYEQRRDLMLASDVSETVGEMREEYLSDVIMSYLPLGTAPKEWPVAELQQELGRITGFLLPIDVWAQEPEMDSDVMIQRVIETVEKLLAEKNKGLPEEVVRLVEKNILLQVLDQLWKEHIASLDYMRYTIVLRAYGQKDPLNEYKKEAFNMFSDMLDMLRERVTFMTCRVQIQTQGADDLQLRRMPARIQEVHETPQNLLNAGQQSQQSAEPVKQVPFEYGKQAFDPHNPETWGKVSRNDLCPCGSGQKYKHCHGKIAV